MSDNAEAVAVDTRARKKRDEYTPRLPDAVRRQAERAEELAQEQAEHIAQDSGDAQNQEQNPGSEEQQNQPVEVTPEPQPPTPAPDEALWQSRYQSLQGKYNAEIPSLRQQVQHLEHLIASMHAAPAAPAQIDLQPAAEDQIPEDDYQAYGPDFVDSSRRWARVEAAQQTRPLERQIAELREHQEAIARQRTQDSVRFELDRDPDLAGRWEQIDHDQNFHAWLAESDPFSGARRHDMLRAAYASGDAVRTGRFFKAYLEQTAPERYSPPLPPPQTPRLTNGSNGAGPRVDLAQYAAPGRASNATPGIGGARAERLWSNRDIAAFYSNKLRGGYRGREAEAEALELDIVAAGREGRVRNS